MRVGSLFSGIGGLDLGLERAGMEIVWQVENNPFCQKVLKKHWQEVPCYGDIKEIDFTTLPAVDLICGGFPCQPVSYAGKRQGSKDERWLWPEFYRAICEAGPRWVLVENVPGLLSADDGRLFGGILGDLADNGYDAQWSVLSAFELGAPQIRDRLFLVAYANIKGLERHWMFKERPRKPSTWQGVEKFNWLEYPTNTFRVVTRIPNRVDRIKSLGNSVVPQIAEWIGKRIMEAMDCNQ